MNMIVGLVGALDRVRSGLGSQSEATLAADARQILAENGAMMALQEGETAPDFDLPSTAGEIVRLSERLGDGPVVLTFYRGGWCAYCSGYLSALQAALPAFRAAGAQLIAVSPQTIEASIRTVDKIGIGFLVLSDHDNAVTRQFGLVFRLPEAFRRAYAALDIDLPATNGSASFELPVPATFVIRSDRTITYAAVDADYTRRPDPGSILSHLQAMAPASGKAIGHG
jgi:peroxiredoxin